MSDFILPAIRAARQARIARAAERATRLASTVKELQAAGVTSLNGIAAALNASGVPTPAGRSHWHPTQVGRLLRRLAG